MRTSSGIFLGIFSVGCRINRVVCCWQRPKILFMIGGSLLVPALLNLMEDTQCDTHPTLNYIALYIVTTVVSKSKHLKSRLVSPVRDGFGSQRILPFSSFYTLSVFSDPKVIRCPLFVTVLAHNGFCRFPVSRHFPFSVTPSVV